MKEKIVVFWFRRDLRFWDNTGLQAALRSGLPVLPLFIFDKNILNELDSYDRRVDYFHQALTVMNEELKAHGSCIKTDHGKPAEVFAKLSADYDIDAVYCNGDYEPAAIRRDEEIEKFLRSRKINFYQLKDQVIFERSEITKDDGDPYTVYTPYAKKWRQELKPHHYEGHPASCNNFLKQKFDHILPLKSIGFEKTDIKFSDPQLDEKIIDPYDKNRDYPGLDKTTRLGIALRFGTISIRKCVAFAKEHNDTWLSELIWREFFMQILFHYPKVVDHNFRPEYDFLKWRNNENEFDAWCNGKTGYPIVDAGMNQLNETGFMHNRVRMITASFLCKHLLIDWRWGESYFASKLIDYELASNNGNWQWAAGTGCDAAPYFRIFNPARQRERFDQDLTYIRRWNPGYEERHDQKIVEHDAARKRALKVYKEALDKSRR